MKDMFRLAVVDRGCGDEVMVERNGALLPLVDVVGRDAVDDLERTPVDLMPLLMDWPHWEEMLAKCVRSNRMKFEPQTGIAAEWKFRPPLTAPGKIVCIGANYHDHIAEMPIAMTPSYPYSFLKPANNTLRGSGEPVSAPKRAKMVDWEAELAVVIGATCRDVAEDDALSVIAGYSNFNDLSARDWLESRPPIGVDWVQHKAFDGFAPMGPYLTPARFVPDCR